MSSDYQKSRKKGPKESELTQILFNYDADIEDKLLKNLNEYEQNQALAQELKDQEAELGNHGEEVDLNNLSTKEAAGLLSQSTKIKKLSTGSANPQQESV